MPKKERKETQETAELEKKLLQCNILYRLSIAVASSLDLNKVLSLIIQGIKQGLDFDRVGIFLVDEKDGIARGKIGINGQGAVEDITDEGFPLFPQKGEENFFAEIYQGKRNFFFTEDAVRELPPIQKKYLVSEVKQNAIVPLLAKGRLIGMLAVDNLLSKRHFGLDELEMLMTFANQAAIALDNARLYAKEREIVDKLQELDQLKTDFVNMVSHELRTPLTATREALSLILEGKTGEVTSDQKKFLEIARRNINRLSYLVADVLDISKIEAGKLELKKGLVSFGTLVNTAKTSFTSQIQEKNIKLEISFPPDLPHLYADPEWITRVLSNLLSNALKSTPPGGRINIQARDKGKEIEISVTDTGEGIRAQDLERVFDRFWRSTEAEAKGFGLGLPISKSIVELHGGKAWVESEGLGKGSKLTFTLPKKEV